MHCPLLERCVEHRDKPGEDRGFARQGGHMNKNLLRHLWVGVVFAAGLLLGAVASANTSPSMDLRQVGATAIVYKGPQIDVALSYRFAKLNRSGNWLLLDTTMTANAPLELPRTAISVRTPSGALVPLATQEAFSEAYRDLGAAILRANAMREPMGYLIPHRYRPMRLFAERGVGLVFPSVWLDDWHTSIGRLFFQLPGGVEKGNYQLLLNLSEGQVVIPFTI
jgi:hypothetical protein